VVEVQTSSDNESMTITQYISPPPAQHYQSSLPINEFPRPRLSK